nr:hypothetical protein [Nitrosomonas nitrosa]
MPEHAQADFCIEIDFQRGSESPSRVFRAMSELIESFQAMDATLIESIDPKIEPVTVIEDIESGSIRAWLRYTLHSLDDTALKDLNWKKQVGAYLVKAKYFVLSFMQEQTEISNKQQVEQLESQLLAIAEQTNVTHLPTFSTVNRQRLMPNIGRVANALSHLQEQDRAIYITQDSQTELNARFNYVPENIEKLLTQEVITSKAIMILKVKKPDYLGESQWEFRHGTRPIDAKILDTAWLRGFQNRQYDVRPGDSLRVDVEISVKYGYDGEVVGSRHDILKVIEILRTPPHEQLTIPD